MLLENLMQRGPAEQGAETALAGSLAGVAGRGRWRYLRRSPL